jgi:D-alanyl-D-alanine carboxypeptidase
MPSLVLGQKSPLAKLFNEFLRRRGFAAGSADVFNAQSQEATRQLQQWLIAQDPANRKSRIQVDGRPGNQTFGYACAIDRDDAFDPPAIANAVGVAYPARLESLPAPSTQLQIATFGKIVAKPAPTASNRERIIITNGFESNIVSGVVPQLIGKDGASASGKLSVHKLIADQFLDLWAAWERLGLTGLVTGFGGLWVPRFIRGSTTTLSNHAWGTAFDVNVSANYLWHLPAFPGENGSLFKLVPVAQDYGFGWGGHYRGRLDGMHFEALKVLTKAELAAVNAKYGGAT